jgi:hypothetical protein
MSEPIKRLPLAKSIEMSEFIKNMAEGGRIRMTCTEVARLVTDEFREFVSGAQIDRVASAVGILIRSDADERRLESRKQSQQLAEARAKLAAHEKSSENGSVEVISPRPLAQDFDVSARIREILGDELKKIREEQQSHVAAAFKAVEERVTAAFREDVKVVRNETRHNDDAFVETLAEQETKVAELEQAIFRIEEKLKKAG